MLIVLGGEHKEHLKFLNTVPIEFAQEFTRISVEFLTKGANPKVYQGAAKKLQVPVESVQHAVEGIIYLFTECSKLLVNEMDFHDSVLTLGLSEELNAQLLATYLEHRDEIRKILDGLSVSLPTYSNLEWRADVQIARRSLRHQVDPTVTLKFSLTGSEEKSVAVQADPSNLARMIQQLENALREANSSHARRIMRAIK